MGLITHDDNGLRKKPRYHIYNFLDAMAGTRLQLSGEGSWVTGFASVRDDISRVLLVNFDANGSHSEQVPVKFTNLAPVHINSVNDCYSARIQRPPTMFRKVRSRPIFSCPRKVSLYWNCRRRQIDRRAVNYDSLSDAPPFTTSCAGSKKNPLSAWIFFVTLSTAYT